MKIIKKIFRQKRNPIDNMPEFNSIHFKFDPDSDNMVKLNFDKLKSQLKNSFNEELLNRNGNDIFPITAPLVILFCASLMTGQSWIFWGLSVLILAFWFIILKNKTSSRNNMQEPPVLVVERSKAKDYDLFLKKASQRKPAETDKLSFTFGYLLRSRDPQWLNHAISTVWRHLRRPSKDYVLGQLWPTVQKLLKDSTAFVKMELFRFELGSIPPRLRMT